VDVLVQLFQSSESSFNGENGAILSIDGTFSLLRDGLGEVAVMKLRSSSTSTRLRGNPQHPLPPDHTSR
jgi:hypothetical protein